MNNDPAWNRRLMAILTVLSTVILLGLSAAVVLGTPNSEKMGLSIYLLIVPVVFTILGFALPMHDIKNDTEPQKVGYYRMTGFVFGGIMLTITLIILLLMIFI